MKIYLYLFIIVSALSFNFIFCDSKAESQVDVTKTPPESRFGGTLVIGIAGDVDTFNPLFTSSALGLDVMHLTLLGLADLDGSGAFEPELSESWERSEDNLKLTYHLRKGIKWSDGLPISAYDVKFTYDLLMNPKVGSPRQGYTDLIKKVTVQDSFTVLFEFAEAYPAEMFDTAGEIIPKHVFENVPIREVRTHNFGRHPLGNGPFVVNRWESNQFIELVANENYYGGRPYLDKVIFKVIPDATNRFTQLKTGEIDMLLNVSPEKVVQLKNDPDLELISIPGRVYNYIGYNEKNYLFKKAAVRRALTMVIDRKKIIDALLYGYGRECISPFLPMITWAYNDHIAAIPYNIQKAKEILSQEGWTDSDGDGWLDKNGKKFQFTLKTSTSNQLRSDLAVIIQNQFKKIGVLADIQLLEWTTLLNDMRSRKFDAYIGGLSSSLYIDPTPLYHSTATNMFNYVSYANPRVDELIEKGRVEMDQQVASVIWKKMQEIVYDDQPYTYLFWIDRVVAVKKKFQNVTPITLSSLYQLEKWYKVGDRPQLTSRE